MPSDATRAGPRHKEPARHVQPDTNPTEALSGVTVARSADELAGRRELRSWIAATEWLNAHGYPAAVPRRFAGLLAIRGLAVWNASDREAA